MSVPVFLFAPSHQVNEATSCYIDTLGRAFAANDRTMVHVEQVSEIPDAADVLTVECKSAARLRLARPSSRYWIWLQGIVPEEARLHMNSRWREALWNLFERFTLQKASGLIMVSKAMDRHYRSKYPALASPSFVMPCVNARFDPRLVTAYPDRYRRPSFVYAGSMHAWQGIDLALASFSRVRAALPNASLTLLTRDKAGAEAALRRAKLADVAIDFVPLERLQAELAKYKYGWVLRDDHIVNRVATPTKVSSYMAAGVIPIMTDAVEDYSSALAGVAPLIMSHSREPEVIGDEILRLDLQQLSAAEVMQSYGALFARYFDHDRYVPALASFLRTQLR